MQVNEIFTSLSGEADGFGLQGSLATFVRLQGCNLKCKWCDTARASDPQHGYEINIEAIVSQCTSRHVIITGGEPLLQQEEVAQLVELLCPGGRKEHLITIETNGSYNLTIDPAHAKYETLRWVVDYKLDSSGECKQMIPEVFERLYPLDVIKFVIADLQDYRQAKDALLRNPQWSARNVFSPVLSRGPEWSAELANAIVHDRLENFQFSLQWHKLLRLR